MERQKLGGKNSLGKPLKGSKTKLPKKNSHTSPYQNHDSGRERVGNNHFDAISDDFSSFTRPQGVDPVHCDAQSCNGAEEAGFLNLEERVSFSLDFKSKNEIHDLKAKLERELSVVRNVMRRIERYSSTKLPVNDGAKGGRVKRAYSEIEVDDSESRQHPLNMPAGKNSRVVTGKAEKGMRNSMPSQVRKSSDASFSKEKIPPNQVKKPKLNGKKQGEQSCSTFGMGNSSSKVFRSCCSLLDKLMNQRDAWVFNSPVDAKGLGLYDYFTIIKHPMDLGTVKSRLTTNWYKTPEEFAEDVRLTFHNAMKYNMEGHDVNTLAKQFLKMFEDSWVDIEEDYLRQLNVAATSEADLPARKPALAPTSAPKRTPPASPPPPPPPPPLPSDMPKSVDLSETITHQQPVPEAKTANSGASGRARLPKPKAKDPNKRDMTIQEKQKLSGNLQSLPPEKLEGVVRIIKKRNQSLSQNDDEIEVDIDSVDTETLWELDRFVIYYKKSLSKMKRSAELCEIGVEVDNILQEKDEAGSAIVAAQENETDEKNTFSSPSNEGGKPGGNASLSNDSSSSSSDSGSSSSDSDTDSSSS